MLFALAFCDGACVLRFVTVTVSAVAFFCLLGFLFSACSSVYGVLRFVTVIGLSL